MCWKAPSPDEAVASSKWNRSAGNLVPFAGVDEPREGCVSEGQSATITDNNNETGNAGAFIINIMLRASLIDQQG